jgi:toxin ParE1/3/4
MRRIRYDEAAVLDLNSIFEWIAAENPAAADRVLDRIVVTIERLSDFAVGKPGRIAGTFDKVVVNLPYIITYELDDDGLTVLAVRHTSRRPLG